jgi:hypothetical protein
MIATHDPGAINLLAAAASGFFLNRVLDCDGLVEVQWFNRVFSLPRVSEEPNIGRTQRPLLHTVFKLFMLILIDVQEFLQFLDFVG